MKLSQAIRKGCELTEPITDQYFDRCDPEHPKACAIGAAAAGVLGKSPGVFSELVRLTLEREFPELTTDTNNPVTYKYGHLASVIVDLTDYRGWTREQIADWLEREGL